ncbi:hypothetical protein LTR94_029733, partial [Friedmanniomyces endolithicus]
MSMTYADADAAAAEGRITKEMLTKEVFVPRYARKSVKKNKPVKTWMIVAPIAAVAVIGTAAAMMMGQGEAEMVPAETASAPAQVQPQIQPMQTAPG